LEFFPFSRAVTLFIPKDAVFFREKKKGGEKKATHADGRICQKTRRFLVVFDKFCLNSAKAILHPMANSLISREMFVAGGFGKPLA
jgi:hypothetical protein